MPDDGGPAFQQSAPFIGVYANGMTLRDYFAAKALQGLIANPDTYGNEEHVSGYAYTYADAMLAEREKGKADG